MNEGKEFAYLD